MEIKVRYVGMLYAKSLENIEKIKNLILPLDAHQIFFDFSNNSEFKVLFFDNLDSENILEELIRTKFQAELPLARIQYANLDFVFLSYEDPLTRYMYNLTTHQTIINDIKTGFKNQSTAQLVIEMNKLLLKLKNM